MFETLNPADMTKLDNAVQEASDSLVRQQGEKDLCKEIAARMKEELNIATSDFNRLAKERFVEAVSEQLEKLTNIQEMNEKLIEHRRKTKTTRTMPAAVSEEDDV